MRMQCNRLDEHVRRATQPTQEQTAALEDPLTKHLLLQEITNMASMDQQPPPVASAQQRRPTILIVAGAAVAIALALTTATMLMRPRTNVTQPAIPTATANSAQSTPSTTTHGDVFGSGTQLSCVDEYSPQTLGQRAFAFDGTVLSVGGSATTTEQPGLYVPVAFHVNRWYRGGHDTKITVAMFPPSVATSAGNAAYGIGSRLLVSGESRTGAADPLTDPISWACGFTRWYTDADARKWEQAFR